MELETKKRVSWVFILVYLFTLVMGSLPCYAKSPGKTAPKTKKKTVIDKSTPLSLADFKIGGFMIGTVDEATRKKLADLSSYRSKYNGKYLYKELFMEVSPDYKYVHSIATFSMKYATRRNIKVGSTYKDIVNAYGNPHWDSSNAWSKTYIYEYFVDDEHYRLLFTVINGAVNQIHMEAGSI